MIVAFKHIHIHASLGVFKHAAISLGTYKYASLGVYKFVTFYSGGSQREKTSPWVSLVAEPEIPSVASIYSSKVHLEWPGGSAKLCSDIRCLSDGVVQFFLCREDTDIGNRNRR